jgi:hypothetical protein
MTFLRIVIPLQRILPTGFGSKKTSCDGRHSEIATTRQDGSASITMQTCNLGSVDGDGMMSVTRACVAASAVLCFAIGPAAAQYNIFDTRYGTLTDVYINGVPEPLASVRQFEERCQTSIEAGEWWVDNTGRLGRVGGPAIYNINTCQFLGSQNNATRPRSEESCTFFAGGSICSGPGWRTVN